MDSIVGPWRRLALGKERPLEQGVGETRFAQWIPPRPEEGGRAAITLLVRVGQEKGEGTWMPGFGTHGPASRDLCREGNPGPRWELNSGQVHGAGLAVERAPIIGEALADREVLGRVPADGTAFKPQLIAAGFGLDRAEAQVAIEVFDGSEIFHGCLSFLADTAEIGRLAAKRRQRWKKVRLSAHDRRYRLSAML